LQNALAQGAEIVQEVHKGAATAAVATTTAGVATLLNVVSAVTGILATTAGLILTVYLIYKTHLDVKRRKLELKEIEERQNGHAEIREKKPSGQSDPTP
jgi:hypothetical protein